VQFVGVLVFSSVLLFRQETWSLPTLVAGAVATVWSLVGVGALMEGKRWAWAAEVVRVALLGAAAVAALAPSTTVWAALVGAVSVLLLVWLAVRRKVIGALGQRSPAAG